jgi:probable phosphoglycerate mutase
MERRRILLMRHGSVEYFDSDTGRPLGADEVPLTTAGVEQARAVGGLLRETEMRIDRVVTSGLPRTVSTAHHVLDAAGLSPPIVHWPQMQEIRGGRLAAIPEEELKAAFTAAFDGGHAPGRLRDVRFLNGETIGAMIDRVLPAFGQLLAATDWDTALVVLHGGVNRALLSHFLAGPDTFLGGIAQDPGCLNIVDAGPTPSTSVVRLVNFCPLEPLQTHTRLTTMEVLLRQYLRYRQERKEAPE